MSAKKRNLVHPPVFQIRRGSWTPLETLNLGGLEWNSQLFAYEEDRKLVEYIVEKLSIGVISKAEYSMSRHLRVLTIAIQTSGKMWTKVIRPRCKEITHCVFRRKATGRFEISIGNGIRP